MQSSAQKHASDHASFLIQDGQTVLFIGDSITDCGRRDECAPMGNGYVRMAVDLVIARYPQSQISFINTGIGGNTVINLLNRWQPDTIAHKPDWLSVMIGINDLHSGISVDQYRQAYYQCLEQTRRTINPRLILMDPFYIATDSDPDSERVAILKALYPYIDVVREFAAEYDALHVPTHDIFQQHLQFRTANTFCPEPVHPNPTGHQVIAHAWLNAVGW